eukprot:10294357-Alexandrium_andersonii.AAC.1
MLLHATVTRCNWRGRRAYIPRASPRVSVARNGQSRVRSCRDGSASTSDKPCLRLLGRPCEI